MVMPGPRLPAPESAATAATATSASSLDRRRSGERTRARDRLMDRATQPYTPNQAITGLDDIENLMLFIDDDLRETALSLARIEGFLVRTLALLETREIRREQVQVLAADPAVLDHLDGLTETLESLRRRLAKLAGRLR
jgi:hypothetical protein